MKKKELSTKELAMYLHMSVEEAKSMKSLPEKTESIESKADAPVLEDPDAWYCANKKEGTQYSIDFNGEKYCLLQKHCRYHMNSEHKVKKCSYKR
ncbi:MAG: hypothetical protein QW666_01050 [Candidatus Woesearchaeota archaeon]